VKLTIVGAGGFRTPAIYAALLGRSDSLEFEEIRLVDPDAGRLGRIRSVLEELEAEAGIRLRATYGTEVEPALEGSDVVYCAIRVGGLEGRLVDERVAVDLGLVGQETTGPGGIAFALRTVPAAVRIAEAVARRAPDALLINFTNPAGLVTEALRRVLDDRVVGICDAPPDMCARVATALGRRPEELWFDYFGINHLGWLRAVRHRGVDLLPGLLEDDDRLSTFEEGRLFGGEWLRALGMIPNEYLFYFDDQRGAAEAMGTGELRAAVLSEQQAAFYARDGAGALADWRATTAGREASYMAEAWTAKGVAAPSAQAAEREAGGYGAVALDIVEAMTGGPPRTMILNTANRSAMPFLDADAVVEVPCVVGPGGIVPTAVGEVPMAAKGLILQVRAAERAAIDAALGGSRSDALRAFALHPLVPSVSVAEELLRRYVSGHAELAGRFS